MKLKVLLILVSFIISTKDTFGQSKESTISWDKADWIGYTKDNRLEKWSTRDFVRNQPPMDIILGNQL